MSSNIEFAIATAAVLLTPYLSLTLASRGNFNVFRKLYDIFPSTSFELDKEFKSVIVEGTEVFEIDGSGIEKVSFTLHLMIGKLVLVWY